jgi:hypothetical protein
MIKRGLAATCSSHSWSVIPQHYLGVLDAGAWLLSAWHDHLLLADLGLARLQIRRYGAPSIGGRLDHEAARRSRTLRRTEVAENVTQQLRQQETAERLVRTRLGGDFILDEPEIIPAIWGQGERVLWAEGEGIMITGHQGVGKTIVAQQLVLHRIGLRAGDSCGSR